LVSTFFNLICGPAYYSYLGEGKLNVLLYVHVLIALLNFVLGNILGKFFYSSGVIIAWSISLTVGSLLLLLQYQKSKEIFFKDIFRKKHLFILPCLIASLTMSFWGNKLITSYDIKTFLLALIFFIILVLPFLNRDIIKYTFNKQKK
jgi:O-antigen/teichoic acid export membrane protein